MIGSRQQLTDEEEATVVMASAHLDDRGIQEVLEWAREARAAQRTGDVLDWLLKGVVRPGFVHGQLIFAPTAAGEVFAKGGTTG